VLRDIGFRNTENLHEFLHALLLVLDVIKYLKPLLVREKLVGAGVVNESDFRQYFGHTKRIPDCA
jgi:hypothetical protein